MCIVQLEILLLLRKTFCAPAYRAQDNVYSIPTRIRLINKCDELFPEQRTRVYVTIATSHARNRHLQKGVELPQGAAHNAQPYKRRR